MAVSLTHTTVAVGTDAGNGEIRKAQWNENHTLTLGTNKLLGRATAGDGAVEEIDCTAVGRALLDDATTADQRTTLGLGTGDSPTFTGLTLTGVSTFSAGTALLPSLVPSGDPNTGMWFPAADTIAWSTGGSERMRINSSGNVGIGTSSPLGAAGYKWLTISGTTGGAMFSLTGNGGEQFRFQMVDGTATYLYTLTNTPIILAPNGVERARFNGNGNVGIGTASPNALLSVNGIASFGAGAAATPSIAAFGDLNTGFWFPAADTIAASTNGAEVFRVDSLGNFGIGTTSFGTSAAKVFALGNATAPSTGPADTLQIYSSDLSAGNTMLSLWTEGTVVNANVTAATTHRIAIRVNGTVYYLLANTSA